MYYKECEHCGATLDPGEHCGCISKLQELKEVKKENAPSKEAFSFKQLSFNDRPKHNAVLL